MTIVKQETVELTQNERNRIETCIDLLTTIMNGASDPILHEEAQRIAVALVKFRNTNIRPTIEEENLEVEVEPTADFIAGYNAGYNDGLVCAKRNPRLN